MVMYTYGTYTYGTYTYGTFTYATYTYATYTYGMYTYGEFFGWIFLSTFLGVFDLQSLNHCEL